MALKLTLKPGEKFVINGAVVVNGERRSHLLIQNKVSPVKRIYFAVQMLYLDEKDDPAYYDEFARRMQEFMSVISDEAAMRTCGEILNAVNSKQYYRSLTLCKSLLPFERSRLEYVAEKNAADHDSVPAAEPDQTSSSMVTAVSA